jgi:hypothetical protein
VREWLVAREWLVSNEGGHPRNATALFTLPSIVKQVAKRQAKQCAALFCNEMERGLPDADLGGNVYKKRIARAGAGKSGGYRAIVFFKSGERTFFVYGFAKSDRDNIDKKELKALREDAKEALAMNDGLLRERLKKGRLIELIDGESNK